MNGSRFRLRGDTTFSTPLGALCGVTPVASPGHPPHVVANFVGGGSIELDVAAVAKMAREFPGALSSLAAVDYSGMAAEVEP